MAHKPTHMPTSTPTPTPQTFDVCMHFEHIPFTLVRSKATPATKSGLVVQSSTCDLDPGMALKYVDAMCTDTMDVQGVMDRLRSPCTRLTFNSQGLLFASLMNENTHVKIPVVVATANAFNSNIWVNALAGNDLLQQLLPVLTERGHDRFKSINGVDINLFNKVQDLGKIVDGMFSYVDKVYFMNTITISDVSPTKRLRHPTEYVWCQGGINSKAVLFHVEE